MVRQAHPEELSLMVVMDCDMQSRQMPVSGFLMCKAFAYDTDDLAAKLQYLSRHHVYDAGAMVNQSDVQSKR